ncbi:hypothetical protein [Pedobacter nototheniae]|uniref:hypothetical protein n=1 Tax=Pedobacter nototheniae TaxID=2488994 RepID=UPI0029317760|nr:hypothetical protein [Pedobacter nototheniae]
MKRITHTLFCIILIIFIGNKLMAQDIVQTDSVGKLITKNGIKLDSIFKDCELHYAMIKMDINKLNQVTEVSSLNNISNEFYNIFSPLKKMTFPKIKGSIKKTIVFIYVVYPRRKCNSGEVNHKSTLTFSLPELTHLLAEQVKKNPKTIYYGVIETYPEYIN